MKVFYSPDYVGAHFSFETTRKAKWVADSLLTDPIAHIDLMAPEPLSMARLSRIHSPHYLQAIQTGEPRALAQAQELQWDAGLWPMVLASNGGMVAAALEAMKHGSSGSLSSGLHHARRDSGAGYCTFNGLALAALEALQAGAQRVLILDLDAHCGGGTQSLICGEPRIWQLDISVDDYDGYESGPQTWLSMVKDSENYLSTIAAELQRLENLNLRFDLCLYNAGMDPFEGCPDGGLTGITHDLLAQREQIVFSWCKRLAIPTAFALAGGYIGEHLDPAGLTQLHRLSLQAAANSLGIDHPGPG
jgi:acetoin utilization deacetylase AcuC-like enzyme